MNVNSISKKLLYSILVPFPIKNSNCEFDYIAEIKIEIGTIVEVPFGNRGKVWGVVTTQKNYNPKIVYKKIYTINEKIILNEKLLKFIDWVSEWTMSSPGSILKLLLSDKTIISDDPKEKAWKISSDFENIHNNNKKILSKSQKKILDYILGSNYKTENKILQNCQVSKSIINNLAKKNIINKILISKTSFDEGSENKILPNYKNTFKLTTDQKKAVKKICYIIKNNKFNSILIDGVTGSGKTEVYFEAIKHKLHNNKSSLILLPEIFLSQEWKLRFKKYFGFNAIEWHSNLPKKQRKENWFNIFYNNPKVIVGARSALFLPIKELGLIVIDEEHDQSYKQEDGVKYHARDMALYRAKLFQIPIILSSATPSIETWHNTINNNFHSINLPKRIGKGNLPSIELIDMKQEPIKSGQWISRLLLNEIEKNKRRKHLSLLFLNRRGYAPIKLCSSCGEKIGCPNCLSWLVEHKIKNKLICHQCGYSRLIPLKCNSCKLENTLVSFGPGIERISEEIKKIFPKLNISLLSSDTIKNNKTFIEIINKINNQKIDLIIGTQLISKGYNFKNLTLVGIIDADLSLKGGDLRASEKTFQLLHQVAGRAGREDLPGKVFLQTYNKENLVIQALKNYNRNEFLSIEMNSRKSANMPPFGKLASIILFSKNERLLKEYSIKLLKYYPVYNGVEIYGPAEAQIYIIRGNFRIRFLIKSLKKINIQKVIKNWVSRIEMPSSINLNIDIDPYSFF